MAKANARKNVSKKVKRLPLSRDVIVAVSRQIIIAEGHEALSLRNLAAHLNVTAAALYAYVDDKLDLLRAVAGGEFERLIRLYESVAGNEPIERLCKISYVYVDYARNNPELFTVMFMFPPGVDDPLLGGHNVRADRSFRSVAAIVEQAIEQGKLRSEDPLLTSVTIWSAVHGVASVVLMGAPVGRKREDLLIHSVVTSVLRGLAPPDSKTPAILENIGSYSRPGSA
ncbi:MAG: TetR/AcrR family transcriptional regulator [Pseudomonadales bacterium]